MLLRCHSKERYRQVILTPERVLGRSVESCNHAREEKREKDTTLKEPEDCCEGVIVRRGIVKLYLPQREY